MSMERGLELYEAAVRLHERHARHARELGYVEVAERAEDRARRARARAERLRQSETLAGATLPAT
jgi:hypothetical protein